MMSLPRTTLAAVTVAPETVELRELPLPPIAEDAGLLRVEAAGVCGADVRSYPRPMPPRIMGHENVGYIAAIGRSAAARWGVREGDRVAVEEYLPCGHCAFCRTAEFRFCLESDARARPDALRYGSTGIDVPPGLWGGYSQYMYLHPNSVLHPLPASVPAAVASLALPLGNGYEWAYRYGQAGPGQCVVIFGPGQQGLGCVVAAKAAGAARVVLTGLAADRARLEAGKRLGADVTVCVEEEDALEVVRGVAPEGADLVIDTAAGDSATLGLAFDILRKQGTLVVPASAPGSLSSLPFRKITQRCLTVRGARGHSYAAVEWAIGLMTSGRVDLTGMCSLEVPLGDTDRAIRGTGGRLGIPVIHAAIMPWRETAAGS